MNLIGRRLSFLALVTVLALSSTVVGASATPPDYQVPTTPGFAADMSRLLPAEPYGAFVHFKAGTPQEHRDFLAARGLIPASDFEMVNALYVVGIVAAFQGLRQEPSLSYLEDNTELSLLLDTSKIATRVAMAQGTIGGGPYRDAGGNVLTGSGVGVAVVDSGTDGTHFDLAGRMAKNFKVECTTPVLVWASGPKQGECFGDVTFTEAPDTDTSSGHGTHVSGIVAGEGAASNGTFVGVAPGAKLYGFSAGEGISIVILNAAGAFRWVLENGASQNPPIRIVTNSWGCAGGCAHDPSSVITKLANLLVGAGVTVLFAAGNDAGNGTALRTSGNSTNPLPGVIGVANYFDSAGDQAGSGSRDNTLDASSSRGLSGDAATWPDISAPGTWITASCTQKRNKPVCETGLIPAPWPPFYATISGTSMATPFTAGAIALLLQASPALTPAQIEDILQDNAHKFTGGAGAPGAYVADPQNSDGTSSFDKGAGLLDLTKTLDAAGVANDGVGGTGTPTVAITSPANGSTQSGIVAVAGTATDNSAPLGTLNQISGDGGDYSGPGAADLVSLSSSESATGINYTIQVRDVDDVGPGGTVQLRLTQRVNGGNSVLTNVNLTATGATPTATSPATSASKDSATDTVSFFVPFTNLGNPGPNSFAHNSFISSFIQVIQDYAPGGVGGEVVTRPRNAEPYPIKPAADAPPLAQVKLSVDGGAETNATMSGASPSYGWSGDVNLTGLSVGAHTITSRLYLDGALRATSSISVSVPYLLPGSPINLTAKAIIGGIRLNWGAAADNGNPITNYIVFRGASAATVAPLTTLGNVLTYDDTAVTDNVKYYYKIAAVNVVGTGNYSNAASATANLSPPPAVIMTKPADGSLNPKTVTFSGTGQPGAKVKVYEASVLIFQASVNSNGLWFSAKVRAEGLHAVLVNQTDSLGQVGPDITRTFDVDAGLPGGSVTTANNAFLLPGETISGTGTDNREVLKVVLTYRNIFGTVVGTQEADFDTDAGTWSVVPNVIGGNSAAAVIYDTAGNSKAIGTIFFTKTL